MQFPTNCQNNPSESFKKYACNSSGKCGIEGGGKLIVVKFVLGRHLGFLAKLNRGHDAMAASMKWKWKWRGRRKAASPPFISSSVQTKIDQYVEGGHFLLFYLFKLHLYQQKWIVEEGGLGNRTF